MVVQNVKKELYQWNSSYVPDRLPSHPVELSYWVIQNLPLDDDLRLNLMGIDSAVQRLRCSLSIVQKVQTLSKVLYLLFTDLIWPCVFSPFCTCRWFCLVLNLEPVCAAFLIFNDKCCVFSSVLLYAVRNATQTLPTRMTSLACP